MAKRSFNVTGILNNFKSLMAQVYEKGCTHKINKNKDENIYLQADLCQRYEKLLTLNGNNQIGF